MKWLEISKLRLNKRGTQNCLFILKADKQLGEVSTKLTIRDCKTETTTNRDKVNREEFQKDFNRES